jgi:hypothetical protein
MLNYYDDLIIYVDDYVDDEMMINVNDEMMMNDDDLLTIIRIIL